MARERSLEPRLIRGLVASLREGEAEAQQEACEGEGVRVVQEPEEGDQWPGDDDEGADENCGRLCLRSLEWSASVVSGGRSARSLGLPSCPEAYLWVETLGDLERGDENHGVPEVAVESEGGEVARGIGGRLNAEKDKQPARKRPQPLKRNGCKVGSGQGGDFRVPASCGMRRDQRRFDLVGVVARVGRPLPLPHAPQSPAQYACT